MFYIPVLIPRILENFLVGKLITMLVFTHWPYDGIYTEEHASVKIPFLEKLNNQFAIPYWWLVLILIGFSRMIIVVD